MKKHLFSIILGVLGALFFSTIELGGIRSFPALFLSASLPIIAGLLYGFMPTVLGLLAGLVALTSIKTPYFGAIYMFVDILPVIIIIALARFYKNTNSKNAVGKIVSWLNLFASVIACLVCYSAMVKLKVYEHSPVLQNAISHFLNKGLVVAGSNSNFVEVFVKHITPFFVYIVTLSWMTHILLCAALGDMVARKIGKTILKPDFINFKAPLWSILIVPVFALLGLISSGDIRFISFNIALVLTTPLTLQGLAYFHKLVENIRFSFLIIFAFYVILAFIGLWAVAVLMILGLCEFFLKSGGLKKSHDKKQEI